MAVALLTLVVGLNAGHYTGYLTDPADWRKVFYISSAVYIACNTFFIFFGTSKKQKWNEPIEDVSKNTGTVLLSTSSSLQLIDLLYCEN
ncbi:Sodium-dependent phosphate transporter [Operophtera brumata]|uniref:Sodium-dependent phosphate transporter n=1 Tax=Operophtera brumata TaxID=104452 RepID=A0A0L7L1L1_OPEBR|nr:Sodium-dependent phosphate transporter [Operophtera brumata]